MLHCRNNFFIVFSCMDEESNVNVGYRDLRQNMPQPFQNVFLARIFRLPFQAQTLRTLPILCNVPFIFRSSSRVVWWIQIRSLLKICSSRSCFSSIENSFLAGFTPPLNSRLCCMNAQMKFYYVYWYKCLQTSQRCIFGTTKISRCLPATSLPVQMVEIATKLIILQLMLLQHTCRRGMKPRDDPKRILRNKRKSDKSGFRTQRFWPSSQKGWNRSVQPCSS